LYCLINADGVASKLESKAFNLWPISLLVLNLTPIRRLRFNNILLAAVYYGKNKPDFHVLFDIVTQLLKDCRVQFRNKRVRIRTVALIADLPAKAECLNMKNFNSYVETI
jgi:hypothetical protein